MKVALVAAPLCVAGVVLAVHILMGTFRRMSCSVMRVVTMVVALLLACPLSFWLAGAPEEILISWLMKQTPETVDMLGQQIPITYALCRASVQALIAPILFVSIYIILRLLLLIPATILRRLLDRLSPTMASRHAFAGALVGLACGVIACVAILTPGAGYTALLHDTVVAVQDAQRMSADAQTEWTQIIDADREIAQPLATSLPFRACRALGGKTLFRQMTTVSEGGSRLSMCEELPHLAVFALRIRTISEDFSPESIDTAELSSLADDFDASELLRQCGAEIFSTASEAWLTGGTFLGQPKPAPGGVEEMVLDWMLEQLRTTTPETVAEDVRQIAVTMEEMLWVQRAAQEILPQGSGKVTKETLVPLVEGLLGEELTDGLEEIVGGITELARDTDPAALVAAASELLHDAAGDTDTQTLTGKIASTAAEFSIDLTSEQCEELSDLLRRYPVSEDALDCFAALGKCIDVLPDLFKESGAGL